MIIVDTSALIDALTGPKRSAAKLRSLIEAGERLTTPTLVLYEWWRGPRNEQELRAQEALLPTGKAVKFGAEEAKVAARLYGDVSRPRGRELDLAIAACAITHEAALWSLNREDFADIPGLSLVDL